MELQGVVLIPEYGIQMMEDKFGHKAILLLVILILYIYPKQMELQVVVLIWEYIIQLMRE